MVSATRTWPPPYRRLRVGGTVLRVAVVGQGPPLLLVNGIGGNIEMWEPVARQLRSRTLVMFDAPGTGASPPLGRPVRMRGYAALVVRLLDELHLDRVDMLGYSWGGALVQELAHRYPDRVGRVVLAATMPGIGGQPPSPVVMALMATPARYYSTTYLRLVAPYIFGSTPGGADSGHGEARRKNPPTLRGYAQQLYAIWGWSSRPFLRRIAAPVLVLSGDRDPLIPPRNGRILERLLPDGRLEVVPGGHLFLLEQPEVGCALVDDFLSAG